MGGNFLSHARDNLADLFEAQPLAIGAVGLAIGASIAAAVPTTEVEGAYLGETSDLVKRKMTEVAGEQADRMTETGKKVVEAALDEAREQGLTAEGVKSAVSDVSGKVGRVAETARSSLPNRNG